ncbi:alpha/beta hydrolase [Solicola gregarius]|uniref:Alpha/beta hydrolase n=1 Tax=Solicola gregarius TaxID=2908642 RepID=A0AA46YK66_9ACTN|nr:alpha/beta hydrolase [Solicola gregarius]UYM04274.1 alpha/beta hydrolase [Solicola gregarius]
MVLNPQAAADVADATAGPHISDPGADIDGFRREMATEALTEERREVAYVRDVDADGVPCRVFRPEPGAPVLLYAHGGGWVLGDLDTHDRWGRELAVRTGWAVVAVHYRRSPEHPYPLPLDDVETALHWVRANADEHALDASRIVGVGDSSGANLVAGLSVREPGAFAYQVLAYPPLDPACRADSFRTEDIAVLSAAEMRWFWDAYLPTDDLRSIPEAAPAYAEDLSRMPPTLLITAEHDVLRDEGEQFAARLAAAGVGVAAQRHLGVVHGFWRRPWDYDPADAALDELTGLLARLRT